jgi:hypothetical protein
MPFYTTPFSQSTLKYPPRRTDLQKQVAQASACNLTSLDNP